MSRYAKAISGLAFFLAVIGSISCPKTKKRADIDNDVEKKVEQQHEDVRRADCDSLYQRGNEIGRGHRASVYHIDKCLALQCPAEIPLAVKEAKDGDLAINAKLQNRAAAAGAATPVFEYGKCTRHGENVGFLITERLNPANFNILEAFPEEFAAQAKALLVRIHNAGITHGDIHLGNFLYKGIEEPIFYLTDFDEGLELNSLTVGEAQNAIDFENDRLKKLLEGNYYPPGGLPNLHAPWQPYVYQWKKFDLDRDGKIIGEELKKAEEELGSRENAEAISSLYDIRMHVQLKPNVKFGVLADLNNDGELSDEEIQGLKKSPPFPAFDQEEIEKIAEDYRQFGANFRVRFTSWVSRGSDREVTSELKADNILVVAAGDITKNRRFPLMTAPLFAELARIHGYRFVHFNGSLSAPWVPYWSKIFMILDQMTHAQNKVIVWLDDDGIVSPKSDMIEQYIKAYKDKDVILAMDPEWFATLNTGAVIVRNTDRSRELLLETIRVGREARQSGITTKPDYLVTCSQAFACLHEQQAMQELYLGIFREEEPRWKYLFTPDIVKADRQTRKNWREYIEVVPQIDSVTGRNLNIFFHPDNPYKLEGRYFLPSRAKVPYRLAEQPFFIQPAGKAAKKYDSIKAIIQSRHKHASEKTARGAGQ